MKFCFNHHRSKYVLPFIIGYFAIYPMCFSFLYFGGWRATYHSVIPSEVEGSQDWLSEMFRLRFATLNMTDYALMK